MQVSSLDHLVWNGFGPSSCALANDGWFCLDHIPVISSLGIFSSTKHAKPLELKRNPTLNCNDKGACRRFSKGLEKLVAKLGPDLNSLSLQEITNESMQLVSSICKRRNNKRTPSIWSPLAHVLNLRVSALGATVRMGLKGDSSSLHPIILRLRDDERKTSLNEDEIAWLEDNGLEAEPLDWDDWRNQYPSTALAAKELLRIKKLLSQENRREFRRIHSNEKK